MAEEPDPTLSSGEPLDESPPGEDQPESSLESFLESNPDAKKEFETRVSRAAYKGRDLRDEFQRELDRRDQVLLALQATVEQLNDRLNTPVHDPAQDPEQDELEMALDARDPAAMKRSIAGLVERAVRNTLESTQRQSLTQLDETGARERLMLKTLMDESGITERLAKYISPDGRGTDKTHPLYRQMDEYHARLTQNTAGRIPSGGSVEIFREFKRLVDQYDREQSRSESAQTAQGWQPAMGTQPRMPKDPGLRFTTKNGKIMYVGKDMLSPVEIGKLTRDQAKAYQDFLGTLVTQSVDSLLGAG